MSEERKAELKEYRRNYYLANKQKALDAARQWAEENPTRRTEYQREYHRQWYQKNKEKVKEQARQWRINNPERFRERQKRWQKNNPDKVLAFKLRHKFGLTVEEYQQMLWEQDGGCAICGGKETPLGVDHCHTTGIVRGILCQQCNAAIGQMRDNPELLRRAIAYLERFQDETGDLAD